jgi:APA family basic amino acid/polyamine antiporter
VLPRTYDPATGAYGNLYGSLLDYVVSAALLFYILTIAGVFRLRWTRPDTPRPYKAFGYPVVPALYIVAASGILVVLALYRPTTTWPGFVIVMLGLPVRAILPDRGRRQAPARRLGINIRVAPTAHRHASASGLGAGKLVC